MTTTPFQHSPLDPANLRVIQVLELLPSRTLEGPIHCKLHHHSLDEDIRYEAVSYTWGDPEPGHTVFVNGLHTLDVTPNCLQVLMSLRWRFHRRNLWVDAICIDQSEEDSAKRERDRQVRIMGDIFRKAQKVLVWLGPAEPSTARTIANLKALAMVKAASDSLDFGSPALRALEDYLYRRMIPSRDSVARDYRALTSMIRSPWWQRVWTLQEQVLSRQCEAYHGRQSIPISSLRADQLADTFAFLTRGRSQYNHDARDLIHTFCHGYETFQQGYRDRYDIRLNSDLTATSLLEAAFLLQAKWPIDKIYGLYGILTSYCNLPLPAPDYNKTAEEVYEETVWAWIKTRGDLSILKIAARPGLIHKLPSWVPAWYGQHPKFIRNIGTSDAAPENVRVDGCHHFDWNYCRGMRPFLPETNLNPSSGIEDTASVATVFLPGTLRVLQARFVGRVSNAIGPDRSHTDEWYGNSRECLYVHLDWCRLIQDVFVHCTTATERKEAFHEMFRSIRHPGIHKFELGADETLEEIVQSFQAWFGFISYLNNESGSRTTRFRKVAHAVKFYFNVCRADEKATSLLERYYTGEFQGREGANKLARQIKSTKTDLVWMRNHKLCILDNNNMLAVTDYWCQKGDEVFVFPGTDSPFVLRRLFGGDCYRLVGPALVDRLLRVGYQKWRSEGEDLHDIVLI